MVYISALQLHSLTWAVSSFLAIQLLKQKALLLPSLGPLPCTARGEWTRSMEDWEDSQPGPRMYVRGEEAPAEKMGVSFRLRL